MWEEGIEIPFIFCGKLPDVVTWLVSFVVVVVVVVSRKGSAEEEESGGGGVMRSWSYQGSREETDMGGFWEETRPHHFWPKKKRAKKRCGEVAELLLSLGFFTL